MVGHPSRPRGTHRTRQSRDRALQICWANVGRVSPHHITILQIAYTEKMDVVCIQEPWSYPGTKTQNHPGYDCYAPVDDWTSTNEERREAQRPRVLTYVRRGSGLRAQQRRSVQSRDMLWVDVNGFPILNIYRPPLTNEVIDYVTHLAPPPNCLVGGDFNVWHEMFEPGVQNTHRGGELAAWSGASGMDYIGTPGDATQRAGHVLDLSFSNIAFASTEVRADMHSGSDHGTLVTTIPGRGQEPLEQYHFRVPEAELERFASLVHIGMARLADPWLITDTTGLDEFADSLTALFNSAIETVGKEDRGNGHAAPWWTPGVQEAYKEHLLWRSHGPDVTEETRIFRTAVRKAKRDYWRHIIDSVQDDKDLYKIIGWHKLGPSLKAPPLIVDDVAIEDTLEKAETLRAAILGRFSAEDDLDHDPLDNWAGSGHLQWDTSISVEEVERNAIGVSSTSPGTDRVTVRLLKACWMFVKDAIHGLYSKCLALSYFPDCWKLAEVAMLPKIGKKDKTSVRSWRPIALLSCVSKGLERIVARRLAWSALTNGILSPQHAGALPKRSAMDLVASFTHDIEAALAAGLEVTMTTMDVQGAFDALLKRRLLKRMTEQGFPLALLKLVDNFLSDRRARVRLERCITDTYAVACGTPQGSPLSPVLYMLYLAELLAQDPLRRFGYADDVALYRATNSLDQNVALLTEDIRRIMDWGQENKVFFAPEKLEMIHLTKKSGEHAPCIEVSDTLTIRPIITAEKEGDQPALRWLGVWFDKKLSFRRHVAERVSKARKVAYHIRSLGRTVDGPPASSLRKAVITCVLPMLLYGTEAWYAGRRKPPRLRRQDRSQDVSARIGWHVSSIDKALALAARGVLPVWRTTPTLTLFRDARMPSAMAALDEAKMRFARRLQVVDDKHPLVRRILPPMIIRGRGAGTRQLPKTKVQRLGVLLPSIPRPKLVLPHFTPGSRLDPTGGIDKETAAAAFKEWWTALPPTDVTVFSDGSERYIEGQRYVGYGYAVYQTGHQIAHGSGSINNLSHVFDAEAIGAWSGLKHAIRLPPEISQQRIWMCIDSTSVIWGVRGDAPISSQWAFLNCHNIMDSHNVGVRWSPGHMGIEGNEAADKLAETGALRISPDTGLCSRPTASGIGSIMRRMTEHARTDWWSARKTKLSKWYKNWTTSYKVRPSKELDLPRQTLHRLLALRSSHGDFAWYHKKFQHEDAKLTCSCGRSKTPDHLVHCAKTQRHFGAWPDKPPSPPTGRAEGIEYLRFLIANPKKFAEFLSVTEFYTRICPR